MLAVHSISLRYCANHFCAAPFQYVDENVFDEERFRVHCPECEMDTCVKCNVLWHEGKNCEEYRRGTNANDLYTLMRKKGWRQCPSCWAIIERIDGCNHMECKCGAHFCYLCGNELEIKRNGDMVYCDCHNDSEEEFFEEEDEQVDEWLYGRRRNMSDAEMEDRMNTWDRPGAFLR